MKDIPLDWMLKQMKKKINNSKKICAKHIGKISTRKDSIIIRKEDL